MLRSLLCDCTWHPEVQLVAALSTLSQRPQHINAATAWNVSRRKPQQAHDSAVQSPKKRKRKKSGTYKEDLVYLPDADAVLAGDGALEAERAFDHPRLDLLDRAVVLRLVRNATVEIAVGDVGADDAREPGLEEVGLGLGDHLGNVRDRDARVAEVDPVALEIAEANAAVGRHQKKPPKKTTKKKAAQHQKNNNKTRAQAHGRKHTGTYVMRSVYLVGGPTWVVIRHGKTAGK